MAKGSKKNVGGDDIAPQRENEEVQKSMRKQKENVGCADAPQEQKERTETISFKATAETKQMLDLLLLMTGKAQDDVFERMVNRFAYKVIKKRVGKGHGHHGYKHGHGRHRHGGCGEGLGFGGFMGMGKAFARIPLWAKRGRQFGHQLIKAFLNCEKDGVAQRNDMFQFFQSRNPEATRQQFDTNLNNMGTEGGNSHGHVFDFNSGEVRMAEHVRERIASFKERFTKD